MVSRLPVAAKRRMTRCSRNSSICTPIRLGGHSSAPLARQTMRHKRQMAATTGWWPLPLRPPQPLRHPPRRPFPQPLRPPRRLRRFRLRWRPMAYGLMCPIFPPQSARPFPPRPWGWAVSMRQSRTALTRRRRWSMRGLFFVTSHLFSRGHFCTQRFGATETSLSQPTLRWHPFTRRSCPSTVSALAV